MGRYLELCKEWEAKRAAEVRTEVPPSKDRSTFGPTSVHFGPPIISTSNAETPPSVPLVLGPRPLDDGSAGLATVQTQAEPSGYKPFKKKIYNNINIEEDYTSEGLCLKLGKSTGETPQAGRGLGPRTEGGSAADSPIDQVGPENPAHNQKDVQADAAEVVRIDEWKAAQAEARAKQKSLDAYVRRLPREVRQFYEETRVADDELRREVNPRLGYEAFSQRGKPLAKSYLERRCEEPIADHHAEDGDDDA